MCGINTRSVWQRSGMFDTFYDFHSLQWGAELVSEKRGRGCKSITSNNKVSDNKIPIIFCVWWKYDFHGANISNNYLVNRHERKRPDALQWGFSERRPVKHTNTINKTVKIITDHQSPQDVGALQKMADRRRGILGHYIYLVCFQSNPAAPQINVCAETKDVCWRWELCACGGAFVVSWVSSDNESPCDLSLNTAHYMVNCARERQLTPTLACQGKTMGAQSV